MTVNIRRRSFLAAAAGAVGGVSGCFGSSDPTVYAVVERSGRFELDAQRGDEIAVTAESTTEGTNETWVRITTPDGETLLEEEVIHDQRRGEVSIQTGRTGLHAVEFILEATAAIEIYVE